MKNLTIRNVSPPLSDALEDERKRRGTSLNQTVLDILEKSLGVGKTRSNGIRAMAGTWSEEEFEEFEAATEIFERVDEDLWR